MTGDPCICGNTHEWRPECYQKQREGCEMSHNVDVTDIVRRAKSEGRREGMEEAARIAESKFTSGVFYPCAGNQIADDILAAIPTTGTAPPPEVEVCEWKQWNVGTYESGCGYLQSSSLATDNLCNYCGKPIAVKG